MPSKPAKDNRPAPVKARAFLRAYRLTGQVKEAAKLAGISRRLHYDWLKNEKYRAAWDDSRAKAGQIFEDELLKRAMEGHLEPVFYQGQPILDKNGKPIGIRRYPDHLLLEACKTFLPERWRAKLAWSKDSAPIKVQRDLRLDDLSDAELGALVELLKKATGPGVGS